MKMDRYRRTQPDLVLAGEGNAVAPQPGWGLRRCVVIFIRRDGLMLGASTELSRTAYELWADEWTHVIVITPEEDEVQMTIRQFRRLVEDLPPLTRIRFAHWPGAHGCLQN